MLSMLPCDLIVHIVRTRCSMRSHFAVMRSDARLHALLSPRTAAERLIACLGPTTAEHESCLAGCRAHPAAVASRFLDLLCCQCRSGVLSTSPAEACAPLCVGCHQAVHCIRRTEAARSLCLEVRQLAHLSVQVEEVWESGRFTVTSKYVLKSDAVRAALALLGKGPLRARQANRRARRARVRSRSEALLRTPLITRWLAD